MFILYDTNHLLLSDKVSFMILRKNKGMCGVGTKIAQNEYAKRFYYVSHTYIINVASTFQKLLWETFKHNASNTFHKHIVKTFLYRFRNVCRKR